MKPLVYALAATVLLAAPAFAQAPDTGASPPPADASPAGAPPAEPPAAGAPAAAAPAAGAKGGKMKAAMTACRSEVQAQGVKGPDRKKAVMDCVAKEHPEMAGRLQCRQDGKAKGLSGPDLKTFIRTCVAGKS